MPIMLMLVHIQQTSVSHFFHWTGANVGHQNSLRPSALDKEEGTISKLNHISTTFKQTQMDFGHEEHLTKKGPRFFLS